MPRWHWWHPARPHHERAGALVAWCRVPAEREIRRARGCPQWPCVDRDHCRLHILEATHQRADWTGHPAATSMAAWQNRVWRSGLSEGLQRLLTGHFALPTSRGADSTVLVVLRRTRALGGAESERGGARLEDAADHRFIRTSAAMITEAGAKAISTDRADALRRNGETVMFVDLDGVYAA